MMRRILAVVIWARTPADIPPEFEPLMATFEPFDTLEIVVGWPEPGFPRDREGTFIARPLRGVARTVTLAEESFVRLPLRHFSQEAP